MILYRATGSKEHLATMILKGERQDQNPLHTYTDADFARDDIDRKSTSGGVHLYNGALIAWSSGKQSLQALFTCEAEYIAATTAVQTTQWLRRILKETHLLPNTPTPVIVDNKTAIAVAKNVAATRKRKFIDLRHHFLREHIKNSTITVKQIPSKSMLADLLTKPIGKQTFGPLKTAMKILPRPTTNTPAPHNDHAPKHGACQDAQSERG